MELQSNRGLDKAPKQSFLSSFVSLKTRNKSGLKTTEFIKDESFSNSLFRSLDSDIIESHIQYLHNIGDKLFSVGKYDVFCSQSSDLGLVLYEIGRLREKTFREIGEGTNKSVDLDSFDTYYNQLFIWDRDQKSIVGGYRLGFGKEIIKRFGRSGFYSNTLFSYRKSFKPVLKESIELGRSFIVKEYQRKNLPLFLLWKGILVCLLKNPSYRYLLGPASISNDYSKLTQQLMVEFMTNNFQNDKFSSAVLPKNKPFFNNTPDDMQTILANIGTDIELLDKSIKSIEFDKRGIPVLLKKYLELNANVIGFNVDPAFNYCIDGLVLVDIDNIPEHVIKGLSKDLETSSDTFVA